MIIFYYYGLQHNEEWYNNKIFRTKCSKEGGRRIMDQQELNNKAHEPIHSAYVAGYDGTKANLSYEQGLNDAWECAKKIHASQIPYEVFGLLYGHDYADPLDYGEPISVVEVLRKVKE
jgi:hypothetical protein